MIYTFLIEAAVIAGGFSLGAFRVSISTIKKVNISCRRHETMAIYLSKSQGSLPNSFAERSQRTSPIGDSQAGSSHWTKEEGLR